MKVEATATQELVLCQDKYDLADKAARRFSRLVADALATSNVCNVALSGGSTPAALYERLLKPHLADSIAWSKIAFFVSDERCVPLESSESNFGNAERLLLDPLEIDTSQRHSLARRYENPDQSAADYEKQIRNIVRAGAAGLPVFDIIFLGMGPDGHTASLFPETAALNETQLLVVKNRVEKLNADRITFTFPLINNAANVIFLVAGEDKAEVVSQVMSGQGDYPCRRVSPLAGRLIWLVDRAAALHLDV
jgi:6-phosphogluconolactonase